MSFGRIFGTWAQIRALFLGARLAVRQADPVLVLGLSASVAAGCFFRLTHLLSQIPFHDKWHALEAVAELGFSEIATSFGANDYSIPITLYFEAVARTIGLEEITFRAPFAIAGCMSLILLPLFAYKYLGVLGTVAFSWLLALSPILVFYGRTARPYGIMVVACIAAIFLLEAWLSQGRREYAIGYVVACVLVGWALFVHLPFVLVPATMALAQSCVSPRERRRQLKQSAFIVLLILGILALVCGPALINDWATLEAKSGGANFDQRQLWPAAIAAFGMVGRRLVLVHVGVALVGFASLLRTHKRLAVNFAVAS